MSSDKLNLQFSWTLAQGYIAGLDSNPSDHNNKTSPRLRTALLSGGENVDDVFDGFVGAVIGGFEAAVASPTRKSCSL